MVHVFIASTRHALRGLLFVWQRERNFRIQIIVAALVTAFSLFFQFTFGEFIAVLFAVAMVLAAEMLNTIVEEVLDVIEPHYSVHVGRLKDVTAGVVLLLSFFALLTGIITFWRHFFITI